MISPLTGLGGILVGALITWLGLGKRIDADERLAKRKFDFDKELAQQKFDQERAQVIHKRRFELAEALLADAYRFRDLMGYVRNGFSFVGEGVSRPIGPRESEERNRLKDGYFVPVERLQKQSEFVTGFMAKRYTALALFGSNAGQAFALFDQSISSVKTASEELIDMIDDGTNDPEYVNELRQDIWAGYSDARRKADTVGRKIDEGVRLIESECRRALEWNEIESLTSFSQQSGSETE